MPQIKSQIKRVRTNNKKTEAVKSSKSEKSFEEMIPTLSSTYSVVVPGTVVKSLKSPYGI